jgi:O-antigen/teichoic acid export membrane protein
MSVVRSAKWLAGGRIVEGAVALLVPIVLVRTISKVEYGWFKQIDLVAALLFPLLVLGLDKSLTYFVPRRETDEKREISTPLLVVLMMSSVVLCFGLFFPGTFATLLGTGDLRLLVVAIVAASAASAFNRMGTRTLIAVGSPATAAVLPLGAATPRAITILVVAKVSGAFASILVVIISLAAFEILLVTTVLAHRNCLGLMFEREIFVKHIKFGGTLGAIDLLRTWAGRIDRYLVSSSLGASVFAVYSVGKTRIPFMKTLPGALDTATAPRYSRLESEGRYEEMAVLWRKRVEALLPLNLLAAAALCVTAQWSIPLVFTEAYSDAIPVFRVFTLSLLIQAMGGLPLVLRALAALKFLSAMTMLSLAVRIGLCLAVLPLGSLPLLAATQLAVTAALEVTYVVYVRRRLGVSWATIIPYRGVGLSLAASLVGVGATIAAAQVVGETPVVALGVSVVCWGLLTGLTLWRLDLWQSVLPAGLRSRRR